MTGGGFQTAVTVQPAIGIEGDFASANPRFSVIAGAGAFVCGANGVRVGRFAWASDASEDDVGAPAVGNNFGSGPVTGFVHREQQGLITQYLQNASMIVQAGFPLTLMNGGDFVVRNAGNNQAQIGQKAYANFQDGSVRFGPTGTPDSGGTSTASTIAAGASGFTASITGNLMTVTAVTSGTLYNGTIVAGASVPAGAAIVNQVTPLLPGEALRGIGRYALTVAEQNIASEAMTGSYGLLTIGGTVAGTFAVGQPVSGGTTSVGTVITDVGTGTGGAGTYIVNNTQTVASAALNTALDVETKWYAMSPGLSGELVKISDHALG
ncbi:hypothetical protein H8A95_15950 [Bradyrhizobium sp. Pear76]|uniref:gp53 minor capsid family protein n=1 Tax=Bradyrhizobium oropedii TaxID=1571201 RepID=UPI001E33CE49|nr:hypothetical protein [Bradyrhizobium oropedii]MCC8963764.1 hypothetical protein [Bradyrhizobium oropedii]